MMLPKKVTNRLNRIPLTAIVSIVAIFGILVPVAVSADSPGTSGESPEIQVATSDFDVGVVLTQPSAGAMILSSRLKVTGPNGQVVFQEQGAWETMLWQPTSDAPNGHYTWEAVYVLPNNNPYDASEGSDRKMVRKTGTVYLQDGIVLDHEPTRRPEPGPKQSIERSDDIGMNNASLIERTIGLVLNTLVPSAHAQDQTISDATPEIFFNDSGTTGNDWVIGGSETDFGFRISPGGSSVNGSFEISNTATLNSLVIPDGGGVCASSGSACDRSNNQGGTDLTVRSASPALEWVDTDDASSQKWGIFTDAAPGLAITDRTGGDNQVFFASEGAINNAIHISAGSDGAIGMGTATPSAHLHILDSNLPDLRLDDGTQFMEMEWSNGVLGLSDDNAIVGSRPFQLNLGGNPPSESFVLAADGNVGMGTGSATAPLHVSRSDNTARVLVEDTGTNNQSMFSLRNHGAPIFDMEDAAQTDVKWEFAVSGTEGDNERFQISKVGSGQLEFRLNADGSAEFAGDVTANGVLLTSTRQAKTDFRSLDSNEILHKLNQLEISKWRYKNEEPGTTHIGPVAEQFQAVFGLSDGKTLNMVDTNGIAFAAIQALHEQNRELKRRIQALETAASGDTR